MIDSACINTMIVEDHELMTNGIREFLETIPTIKVVVTATNADKARNFMKSHEISLIIMDISLKDSLNGVRLTSEFLKNSPDLKILIHSVEGNEEVVRLAKNAGACGYVRKGSLEEFKKAVEIIIKGGSYFDPSLLKSQQYEEPLTGREEEVLQLIAKEKDHDEISQLLKIAPATVDKHIQNIKDKRRIKKAVELERYAKKLFPNLDGPESYS